MPRGMVLFRLLVPSSPPASHQLGLVSQRLRRFLATLFPQPRFWKICMAPIRRWPDAIPRQSTSPKKTGRCACRGGAYSGIILGGLPVLILFDHFGKFNLARPTLTSAVIVVITIALRWKLKQACVVLDHHDRSCGSSCPVGPVGSVDDQVGSCFRDNPNRHSRFIPDALDPVGCREVHERVGSL